MSAGAVNPKYEIWQFHSGNGPTRINYYERDEDFEIMLLTIDVKGAVHYPRKKLKAKFESRSFHFKLENNFPGVEVNFFIDNLAHEIDPSKSAFIVVEDQIVLTLWKVKPEIWDSVIYAPDVVKNSWKEVWREFLRSAADRKIEEEFMEKELRYQWNLSECVFTEDLNFYLNPPPPYGPIPELQDVKSINEAIEKIKTYIKTKQQWVFKPDLLGAAILYKLLKTHKETETEKGNVSPSVKAKKMEKKKIVIKEATVNIKNTGDRPAKCTFVPAADFKRFRGNEFFEKGKYEEAIKCYTEAIKIDSLCPTYYNQRAACYFNLGRYEESIQDANEAISIDPSNSEAYYYKGKSAFLLGRILEGHEFLSTAVRLDPLSPNIDVALQQQNCLKLATMIENSTKLIDKGRTKEGKKLFSELMKYCKVELVDLKTNLYEDLCRTKLPSIVKTLALFDLEDGSNDGQAMYYIIKSFFYSDNKEEALNSEFYRLSTIDGHYLNLIEKLNYDIKAYYSFVDEGDRFLERKAATEAEKCYFSAVNVDPLNRTSNANLQYKIGECKMLQKDYEQAAKHFQLTLRDNDSHKQAQTKLKECLQFLEKYKTDANYETLNLLANAEEASDHFKLFLYKDVDKLTFDHITKHENKQLATLKMIEGQEYQSKKQFHLAIDCYTDAIVAETDTDIIVSLLIKRSQCHYELENFRQAYQDAVNGGQIRTNNIEACLQMGKCCIALADSLREAESMLTIAYNLDRFNVKNIINIGREISKLQGLARKISLAEKAFVDKNYEDAAKMFEEVLSIAKGSNEFKLKRAECLIYLENFKEAETIAASMASIGNTYPEYECLLGMLSYYRGDLTKAILHFTRAKEISHVHHKSIELKGKAEGLLKIKNEGSRAFAKDNHRTALSLYKTAVKIDPLNKFLTSLFHFNIGVIQVKQKNILAAIDAFSSAISIRENHLLAYLKRAECYMESGRRELAVEDYEKVCKLFPSLEHGKLLQNAKKTLEGKNNS